METGNVLQKKGAGRPQISEEIESVREAYTRSPRKSIRGISTQLRIQRSTIHKVLHKNLRIYAYKVQLLQALKAEDKLRQKEFAVTMLDTFIHSFIHFILFSIISKQFNTKSYKYWKDQEKEEAAQRQTLKHA